MMDSVLEGNICDLISSFSVFLIGKLEMVTIDFILYLKKCFPQVIDILLARWEPRDLNWSWEIGVYANSLQLVNQGVHFILTDFLDRHKDRVLFFKVWFKILQMCFDVGHVDFVLGKNACEFMHAFEFIIGD